VSPASSRAKITDCSSRLAYTRVTRPVPPESTDLMIDMTGVMPLPAANATRSSSSDAGVNTPTGASTSNSVPTTALSHSQCDPYPSGVRLTVILSGSCGALDSE
jgi:hypothetical protein